MAQITQCKKDPRGRRSATEVVANSMDCVRVCIGEVTCLCVYPFVCLLFASLADDDVHTHAHAHALLRDWLLLVVRCVIRTHTHTHTANAHIHTYAYM